GCLVPLADEQADAEREELVERTALAGILSHPSTRWRRAEAVVFDDETGAGWIALETGGFRHEEEFQALEAAFVRFSSGTTGRSKGVVLSHRGLAERITAANAALSVGPGDKVLWMLPMAHHFAVSIVLYLYHGACTVLAGSHLADAVLETARRERCTVIYGAPFHFAMLAAGESPESWAELRLAVSTAAPLPLEVARVFSGRFGKPLVQGLGIIEVGLPLLNTGGANDAPGAVGRPLPAYDVELRDEEGRPVASGRVGELWIKGPGMFDAYLAPWQTADEILVDGWFATGDLAVTDAAGRVFIRGRKHSVINVGGMKVFPEEVEAVLLKHPAVAACRVTGTPHPVLGAVPVADVVPSGSPAPDTRELAAWCRRSLAAFKVPVRFRTMEKLDLTASGKVRRA
ncbi:MAG TPA: fatty acid--CoA ligase family protein, partial [Luteolibacter sp.]|nr:fatty acid--CoA ligase family protein [Luteolibacter sp.]